MVGQCCETKGRLGITRTSPYGEGTCTVDKLYKYRERGRSFLAIICTVYTKAGK